MTALDPQAAQLRALAPEPFAAWDGVAPALGSALSVDRRRQLQTLVVSLLGADAASVGLTDEDIDAFGTWRSSEHLEVGERAVLTFAEQFVLDVSACTDAQRTAAMAVLGADAFPFMQVLYVFDFGTRMRVAWEQLFAADPGVEPAGHAELWPALESFMSSVARLEALDPLTTEVVRLRGARAHNCRLCKSLRNVRAANAGTDESVYDEIDHYETSTLSDRHQTALRLVDAMLWQPCAFPADLGPDVRASFTDAEVVELVLDVTRNAANKIAVAFGADAPHVTEGVELYDIDEHGELVYAQTPNR